MSMISSHGSSHSKFALPVVRVPLRDAAKALSISAQTLRRRVKSGQIAHIRDHGRIYFRPEDIAAYIRARHQIDSSYGFVTS